MTAKTSEKTTTGTTPEEGRPSSFEGMKRMMTDCPCCGPMMTKMMGGFGAGTDAESATDDTEKRTDS